MNILTKPVQQFKSLRPSVRSLVYLYWISAFTNSTVGVFTQIFLYQKFTSLALNITAAMVLYTGIMLGFSALGIAASIWRLNIKHGFLGSFMIGAIAIIYLLYTTNVTHAYIAMFLLGLGQGLFWLTVNTFELTETIDQERDVYSSLLNAGTQIFSLLGPASATLLILISHGLGLGTYTLLFTTAPVVYLLGFFCFSSIRDYYPQLIGLADVRHYFTDRANQAAQLYTLGTGLQQLIGVTIPPLVTLFILGNVLRVGVYSTFFALFSALCLLIVAQYRTPENRLRVYGITTFGLIMATLWLGYSFSFIALIIYTVVTAILSPLNRVSSHVIDLKAMELGRQESDFYATMILRDFFLWVWRCVGGCIFLARHCRRASIRHIC